MRNFKKMISLLTILLLVVTLTGCGSTASSGGNTGVWIAVTVMVFIAVFSATSGVVYLVLQKLLPPEKPASKRNRSTDYDYDDMRSPRANAYPQNRPVANPQSRPANNPQSRPVNNPQSRPPVNSGENSGIWICPRDGSRNSGPYCSRCGSNRSSAARANSGHQAPQRPQNAPANLRQPGAYAAQTQKPTPTVVPRQSAEQTVLAAPEKEYRGRFAKREEVQEPETEVDSELLAAIFREAAENPEE